ncbi:MAG: type III toxin-antitoxin system CptIN family toxin [Faecalibacillus sp.]
MKTNKETTQRPHYYAFEDNTTGLLWVIPCSSQIDKYKNIIKNKIEKHKKHDHIQIIKVNGIEEAFLFQDMFPITKEYILNPYIKQDVFMEIKDVQKLTDIEKNAKKIINLMRHGVKFTPTQPDVMRIEQMLINGKDTN